MWNLSLAVTSRNVKVRTGELEADRVWSAGVQGSLFRFGLEEAQDSVLGRRVSAADMPRPVYLPGGQSRGPRMTGMAGGAPPCSSATKAMSVGPHWQTWSWNLPRAACGMTLEYAQRSILGRSKGADLVRLVKEVLVVEGRIQIYIWT
jgi:hypothetical protein